MLTGAGPGGATATVAPEVIRGGFTLNRAGVASAMAIIRLIVTAVATALNVGFLQRREVSSRSSEPPHVPAAGGLLGRPP